MGIPIALFISLLIYVTFKPTKHSYIIIPIMIYIGFILHLIEDYITYGSNTIEWFVPFSNYTIQGLSLFMPYQTWYFLFDIKCMFVGIIFLYLSSIIYLYVKWKIEVVND
jgi:hypothetical protein